ncbi:hypothetical protein A1QO_12110 [Vibrio genomosp. F10 str. ZF-129]|uniref:Uncharacterized protein n=1 Tax=Vibrio genomosp. F10 str. ZF-129 TaxID=1187848 RepID=A0A1E5BDC4_9VIBR|nr:hypothetical protein A1QO_12110 [Vibrio genomosp. F10 str. ZF-129]
MNLCHNGHSWHKLCFLCLEIDPLGIEIDQHGFAVVGLGLKYQVRRIFKRVVTQPSSARKTAKQCRRQGDAYD